MSFKDIADAVLKASPGDQTEVIVVEQDDSLTRFANNCIHQNVTERNVQVIVRSVAGKRVGIAISNDIRAASLDRLALRAMELARLQPENPEFKGLPSPKPITSVAAFDEKTAGCSPAERADRAGVICRKAAGMGYTAAGNVMTSTTKLGVANSLGVFAEFQWTTNDASTVVMAPDSTGWAQASGWRADAIDAEALADEAVNKARLGANPVDADPGEYTVVLDPYATGDMVEILGSSMGALSTQEERSWLNGRFGQKIMADSISIVDDGLDLSGIPLPFDFEGMPKRRMAVIDRGVATGPLYDSFTAGREAGRESTGHAIPPSPSENYGPLPLNLFLLPGSSTVEEMIRSTKRGLYITRFWYTRPVRPRDAVVTGMTRDGTFMIRDGEIAYPVKSLRFTQSYLEALNHAEMVGSALCTQKCDTGIITVPAVKLSSFRFTSGTK